MQEIWPALPFAEWKATAETLHMWTQIVGKVRLGLTPWLNHSWHVTLYVTPRGLTTGPIPWQTRSFRIDFDFLEHRLLLAASDGRSRSLPLEEQAIADFYASVLESLSDIGIQVRIHKT